MKLKFNLTKEIKIKSVVVGVMLMMLILSFFFASKIETFLGLKPVYSKNEVSVSMAENSNYFVTYIDVGQGHSTFIMFPDGKTALIDGGDKSYATEVEDVIKNFGVTTIDYLIATHADSDHIGSFAHILETFEVKNIYRPFQIAGTGSTFETFKVYEDEDLEEVYNQFVAMHGRNSLISRVTSNDYKNFITAIYNETYYDAGKQNQSKVTVFYDGLVIQGENYKLEFFGPLKRDFQIDLATISNTYGFPTFGYGAGNSNGNSAILLVDIFSESFLFTGDAQWSGGSESGEGFAEFDFVKSLTADERLLFQNISVYLAGHHGAKNSSGEDLLQLINPRFVVFSVGKGNLYGHPHQEVIERLNSTSKLAEDYLLRTDKVGTITFIENNNKLAYCIEISAKMEENYISWYFLGLILFISFSICVIFIKFKPAKK